VSGGSGPVCPPKAWWEHSSHALPQSADGGRHIAVHRGAVAQATAGIGTPKHYTPPSRIRTQAWSSPTLSAVAASGRPRIATGAVRLRLADHTTLASH
jgi:hypothetical protein